MFNTIFFCHCFAAAARASCCPASSAELHRREKRCGPAGRGTRNVSRTETSSDHLCPSQFSSRPDGQCLPPPWLFLSSSTNNERRGAQRRIRPNNNFISAINTKREKKMIASSLQSFPRELKVNEYFREHSTSKVSPWDVIFHYCIYFFVGTQKFCNLHFYKSFAIYIFTKILQFSFLQKFCNFYFYNFFSDFVDMIMTGSQGCDYFFWALWKTDQGQVVFFGADGWITIV